MFTFLSCLITPAHCFPVLTEAKKPKTPLCFPFHLLTWFMSMGVLYLPVKMQMGPTGYNRPWELAGWMDSGSQELPHVLRAEPGFSPGASLLPLSRLSRRSPVPTTRLTHRQVSWPLGPGRLSAAQSVKPGADWGGRTLYVQLQRLRRWWRFSTL